MSPEPPAKSARTEFGFFTEFSQAPGMSEAVAFEQAMAEVIEAEACGYDAVWLAEIHSRRTAPSWPRRSPSRPRWRAAPGA